MRWTKRHIQNAVAAKERKRIERANSPNVVDLENGSTVSLKRRVKPDLILRLEDRFGERVQISVWRIFGKVHTSTGQSARQLYRGLEHLITKSA